MNETFFSAKIDIHDSVRKRDIFFITPPTKHFYIICYKNKNIKERTWILLVGICQQKCLINGRTILSWFSQFVCHLVEKVIHCLL